MAHLFQLPTARALSNIVTAVSGALAYFYNAGTSTPRTTYTTSVLDVPNASPVVANSVGVFPPIYLDPAGGPYKVDIKNAITGVSLSGYPVDNLEVSVAAENISDLLITINPIAPAETAAMVTPSDYSAQPLTSPRLGLNWDNATDDRNGLVNLLASGQGGSTKEGARKVRLQTTYVAAPVAAKISDGITFDPAKVLLDGESNQLDFSSKTSGAISCLKLSTVYDSNASRQYQQNAMRGLRDVFIIAPSAAVNTHADNVGLEILDATGSGGSFRAPGFTMERVSIIGGVNGIRLGNGAWGINFNNCTIGHDASNTGGVGVRVITPYTDGSEASTFRDCFCGSRTIAFSYDLGNVMVQGGRYDGNLTITKLTGTGTHRFNGGYSEFVDGDNTSFKLWGTDTNAIISFIDWEFAFRPDVLAVRTKEFFSNTGHTILRNCLLKAAGASVQPYRAPGGVLGSTGTCHAEGLVYLYFQWAPLPHISLQWLANPTMSDATLSVAPFTMATSGGTSPARAAAVSDGSSTRDALKFILPNAAASGSFSRATLTHSVVAGRRYTLCGDFLGALTGSATVFECIVTYKDSAGSTVQAFTSSLDVQNTAVWAVAGIDLGYAPGGAETVVLNIQLRATGTVVGNTNFYASPLHIGCATGES